MKVLIVEDEYLLAEELEEELLNIDKSIVVVDKLGSVKETITWFHNNNCDLLFLDIHLNDGLSFSIFEKVVVSCPVIFVTAYDEYAIKAFEVNSIAYLLKPINSNDLKKALDKYKILQNKHEVQSLIQYFQTENNKYLDRIMLTLGNILKPIAVEDIAYFMAEDRLVFAVTNKNERYFYEKTLYELENLLNPKDFFRVNRSFIVNYKNVDKILSYSKGRAILKLDPSPLQEIIISRNRYKELNNWLSI